MVSFLRNLIGCWPSSPSRDGYSRLTQEGESRFEAVPLNEIEASGRKEILEKLLRCRRTVPAEVTEDEYEATFSKSLEASYKSFEEELSLTEENLVVFSDLTEVFRRVLFLQKAGVFKNDTECDSAFFAFFLYLSQSYPNIQDPRLREGIAAILEVLYKCFKSCLRSELVTADKALAKEIESGYREIFLMNRKPGYLKMRLSAIAHFLRSSKKFFT